MKKEKEEIHEWRKNEAEDNKRSKNEQINREKEHRITKMRNEDNKIKKNIC